MSFASIMLAALLLDPAGKPAPAATPAASDAAKASRVRYCIDTTPTGTRLAKRTCMTRAEWLATGVDPLNAED